MLLGMGPSRAWAILGALYGAVHHLIVNSLALPHYFRDPTPWQIGWATELPSLIGHIAFGVCIAWTSRAFVARNAGASAP